MLARCDNLKVHPPSSDDEPAKLSRVIEKACKKRAEIVKIKYTFSIVAFVVVITASNPK